MAYGKTITIYLEEGSPDGMVTASLSNWNGVCIKAPREDIAHSDYEELDAPGIYFLICTDTDDGQDAVYIGEAENLRKRLCRHIQDYKTGKEKYYWQKTVMFTGSELNKTLIRYLEHHLTIRARAAKRYTVLTKNTYADSVIKRHEKAAMEEFMDNIQVLLAALNYRMLEQLVEPIKEENSKSDSVNVPLRMKVSDGYGEGYLTSDSQFVLRTGARLCSFENKSCPASVLKKRKWAIESGAVDNWVTVEDIVFSSSSAAADFIGGCSLSGPLYWKNAGGISLSELQKKE